MNDPDSHDRAVNTLVSALRTLLSPGGRCFRVRGANFSTGFRRA